MADKVNTFIICKTLMMQPHRFVTPYDIALMQLKNLRRFRQKTMKRRIRLKIQLTSYVDQVFPELQYFFKFGIHHKGCYALLNEASSPDAIFSLHHQKCQLCNGESIPHHYYIPLIILQISTDSVSLPIISIDYFQIFSTVTAHLVFNAPP